MFMFPMKEIARKGLNAGAVGAMFHLTEGWCTNIFMFLSDTELFNLSQESTYLTKIMLM